MFTPLPRAPRALLRLLPILLAAIGCNFASSVFAAAGDLYVTDLATHSILVYAPDGTRSTFASGLSNPQGLAFDRFGNLYAAEMGTGSIFKFTADGTRSTFATGLQGPAGLCFNEFGNLLVAENTGNRIDKITSKGTVSLFQSIASPLGVVFDS